MKLEIIGIAHPTPDSVTVQFKKTPELACYKPGQHASLIFSINGQKLRRTYSFYTSPYIDDHAGITIRAVKNGVVSSHVMQSTRSDLLVEFEGINGDFYIQPSVDARRHLVMFAAGSGITPIISMLRSILHLEPKSSISLVYSNQSFETIIFQNDILNMEREFSGRLKVYHVMTRDGHLPEGFTPFYRGRLSRLIIKTLVKSILTEVDGCTEFYLCGPFSFMKLVDDTIRSLNINRAAIFKEHFHIPSVENAILDFSNLPPREIIIRSGDVENLLVVDGGKTILEAALENNIKVPYSCTEGQCGVCRALLIAGNVKLRQNHILSDDELKAGQILLCQGFAVSENVTIKTRL